MARPKQDLIIERVTSTLFDVYCVDHASYAQSISNIEGIVSVHVTKSSLTVFCNPLYDIEDIIAETRRLIMPKIHEVFSDAFEEEET